MSATSSRAGAPVGSENPRPLLTVAEAHLFNGPFERRKQEKKIWAMAAEFRPVAEGAPSFWVMWLKPERAQEVWQTGKHYGMDLEVREYVNSHDRKRHVFYVQRCWPVRGKK